MIALENIGYSVGQFHLNGLNMRVETGRYAVLMGATGQGKTTLLEIICGLRRPLSGRVHIQGVDVTNWAPGDRQLGYVPQDLALFPHLNVYQHLAFALRLRRQSLNQIDARVKELAQWLCISHLLDRRIQGLSGGESQRVAIGRALSFRPSVLLLDEPLSALDETTRQEMHELLKRLKLETGMTTIHITHSTEEATRLADCQFILANGQLNLKNCLREEAVVNAEG